MFSYKLAKGTPLLEASWWKKRHGRSRSGLCKWSIKRAWNANKWTMAKCNIYTSFFSMLHTSFEVVVSLKVIFYPNGFLEKKNYAKTRPGSDFSTMSYRKGERNAMCLPFLISLSLYLSLLFFSVPTKIWIKNNFVFTALTVHSPRLLHWCTGINWHDCLLLLPVGI